ncbi:MAG: IS200/IS605 family transposase [Patescibacteria group bacterium]
MEIESGKVATDHVHLFLSYRPGMSVSSMMQKIKGKSSYKVFQIKKEIRQKYWGRSMWSRGI